MLRRSKIAKPSLDKHRVVKRNHRTPHQLRGTATDYSDKTYKRILRSNERYEYKSEGQCIIINLLLVIYIITQKCGGS